MSYFHYTSRKAGQNIICSSQSYLLPGKSGKIFLTPTRYDVGHKAASAFAILNEVEIGCFVSESDFFEVSAPRRVDEIKDPDGSIRRKGGGWELTTTTPLLIVSSDWFALDMP